jgi:uncharacterized protein YidB (DUF937 family)
MEADMGLFDNISSALKNALGQAEAGAGPTLISEALAKTSLGDLQGLVSKLQEGGLTDQVQSWLGNGPNLPITPEQIRAALGNEHVQAIAEHFGLPVDAGLKLLAQYLPSAVDKASPDGTLQPKAQ